VVNFAAAFFLLSGITGFSFASKDFGLARIGSCVSNENRKSQNNVRNNNGADGMKPMQRFGITLACVIAMVSGGAFAQGPAAASKSAASTPSAAPATRAANRQLARNVRRALTKAGDIQMETVTVRAKNGVVTLSGSVPEDGQIGRAGDLAKQVQGVVSVRNRLIVLTQRS
jgi:hyperosmotically inducible periplasmic protein